METFIAYFDFLGFKEFITAEENTNEILERRMHNIFTFLEGAISQHTYGRRVGGIQYYDLSVSNLNCVYISDTIILWTNDQEWKSLYELLEVSYIFNYEQVVFHFPIRGVVTKGHINKVINSFETSKETVYQVACPYGKGLVKAHLLCEDLNWSGSIIDPVILDLINNTEEGQEFLDQKTLNYNVPFKSTDIDSCYAFRLKRKDLSEQGLENLKRSIIKSFTKDNKDTSNPSVKEKLDNTLRYAEYHFGR